MAYFSNGSEGSCFDDQCSICKYGTSACPIAYVQISWNYDQLKDETGAARDILSALVKDDGTCAMFKAFQKDLSIANKPLFPELFK